MILIDTHVLESEIVYFSQYLNGYKLLWIPAQKCNKFGRASGGILMGFNLNCNKVKYISFLRIDFPHILNRAVSNFEFNILPVLLNKWNRLSNNYKTF